MRKFIIGGRTLKLLVSVVDEKEAVEALKGGAHIIDVKNPREGSLGANFPYMITKIREVIPKHTEISAAIGDIPNLPGTASLAALGLASCGVNYVKVGLKGPKNKREAIYLMNNVVKAVKEFNKYIKVVVTGYGDYKRAETLNPMLIPDITYHSGADIAMLDTAIKDGRKLTDFLKLSYLKKFVRKTHKRGLIAALAGSLGKEDVKGIYKTNVDILGVRGSVCSRGNRLKGKIRSELVRNLAKEINRFR